MAIYPEVGDILRLTLVGLYDGDQETNNVFLFEVTDNQPVSGFSPSVANYAWGLWVQLRDNYVVDACSSVMEFQRVKGELFSQDTYEFVFAEDYIIPSEEANGGVGGDALPSTDAYQLRLQRPSADFRHGYKRLPGVPESENASGVIGGTAFSVLEGLAAQLMVEINAYHSVFTEETAWVDALMALRIGQFQHNGDPLDVPVFAAPSAIVVNPRVRTQNTRQHGRGS